MYQISEIPSFTAVGAALGSPSGRCPMGKGRAEPAPEGEYLEPEVKRLARGRRRPANQISGEAATFLMGRGRNSGSVGPPGEAAPTRLYDGFTEIWWTAARFAALFGHAESIAHKGKCFKMSTYFRRTLPRPPMIDSPTVDRDGRPGTAAPTGALNEIRCNSKAVAYDGGPASVRPVRPLL